MNRLSMEKRVRVVTALVEGCSINSTCRMTDIAKNTVLKLLSDIGAACERYQRERFKGLTCKRIQADEVWAYCYAKQKNVPEAKQGIFGFGDVWLWVAICADTKLVPTWLVG